jgi:hypothetical protein
MTSFYRQRTSQSGGRAEPFYPPPVEASATPWTITVYSAVHERARWERYCRVANRSYAARGLQAIGEAQVIDIDCYPTYFAEATLTSGADGDEPIGGVRIHSPSPGGRLPLLDELEGYTDIHILQDLVDKLRPQGISHSGGLWIDPAYGRRGLAGDLARAYNAMIAAIQTRWYIGATHQYILDAWRPLGWHPIPTIPYFPYPDDRYQSCVLLGDRQTWPDDLVTWASAQAGDATLDGPGARVTVRPMRYIDF